MLLRILAPLGVVLATQGLGLAQNAKPAAPVGFGKDVVPILRTACLGCHSGTTPSGGYSVASFDDTMKAGRKGPLVVPGKPRESRLYQLVSGMAQPRMPPGAGLKPADVDILRRWIEAGAKRDALGAAAGAIAKSTATGIASVGPRVEFKVSGVLRAKPAPVHSLAWSPDSKTLAAGTYQRVIFFDLGGKPIAEWGGHADSVRSLAFTSDGNTLVAGGGLPGAFGEIRIWDSVAGRESTTFGDHADVVQGVAIAPDSSRVVSVSADKMVKVWDLKAGKVLQTLRDHSDAVAAVAFHPSGKHMATAGSDKSAKVWDLETGKRLYSVGVGDDPVVSLAFTANGGQILTGTEGRLRHWNFGLEGSGHSGDSGHGGMVWSVDVRADRIATASADGKARLYDNNHRLLATFTDAKEWLYSVRISPDGRRLAAGTWDGRILLWDIAANKLERSISTVPQGKP